APQAGFYGVR
uniref:Locustatachykinin-3 n=1 Tax=Locusta migratoria TaxID=7004 RepID=TKL3_LOCMI|nr:RecName: Full=Locustatachykinin-3; AltName: Full=Locustatachykinin III; Short=TK-III [Locusta migratoria]